MRKKKAIITDQKKNKHMKFLRLLGVMLPASLLFGCSSSPDDNATAAEYKVDYSAQISSTEVAYSKLSMVVNKEQLSGLAAQAVNESYSVKIIENPNIHINGSCSNVPIGKLCELDLSLKPSAASEETLNWSVVLPDGVSKSEHTVIKKSDLQVNLPKSSVLQLGKVKVITLTNISGTNFYFNKPIFVDSSNHELTTATISNNTCINEIKAGDQCSFDILSTVDGAQGYLKLDLEEDYLAQVAFSKIVVTGTKTLDIPVNTAKGDTYPFTYTFNNTNTALPATGVSFTNVFLPAADFTLDTANSSCNGKTTIAANSSCTWKGTFMPRTTGNMTMSSTLHYAEGSDVSLSSSSKILLAAAPINTGSGVAENGWDWPTPRFESAKKADNTTCADAEYDKLTGLMWVKDGTAEVINDWAYAKTEPNNLNLCGYHDWRLPTINELASLVNYSDTISPAHWLNNNGFNNIKTGFYWTSTLFSAQPGGYGWIVDMADGVLDFDFPTSFNYVLPVRGPN